MSEHESMTQDEVLWCSQRALGLDRRDPLNPNDLVRTTWADASEALRDAFVRGAAQARLAPTASDEQRARELLDIAYPCEPGDADPRPKRIAQALGAARQQGAEQEREVIYEMVDARATEHSVRAAEDEQTTKHATRGEYRRALQAEAMGTLTAIRARWGSE